MLRSRAQALLEFDVIRERVADRTTYFPARRLAESMQPSYDDYEVALLQQETAEGRAVLDEAGEVDMFCPDDVGESVVRASIGGILGGMDLLAIARTLEVMRSARSGILAVRQHAPMLADMAESIPDLSELTRQIRARIGERGVVRDDATHTLRALRSQITAGVPARHRLSEYAHSGVADRECPAGQCDFRAERPAGRAGEGRDAKPHTWHCS